MKYLLKCPRQRNVFRSVLPLLWAGAFAIGGNGYAGAQSQESSPQSAAPQKQANVISRYTDAARLTDPKTGIGQTGYHIRHALRGWLETPPSRVFGESIGISFGNVPRAHSDATMEHLARNGVRHVRIEVGWAALDKAGNIVNQDLRAALAAAKKHGLRPLVLLNSHEGVPCPSEVTRVTLLRPVTAGDRSLYVSHADAEKIHLFRTGFSNEKTSRDQPSGPYIAVNTMAIFKWDFGGGPGTQTRIDLSRPLHRSIPAGPVDMTTLLAAPLFAARRSVDTTNAALMPVQLDTLHKWIGLYVKPVCRQLDTMVGRGAYDIEVANELMFGAAWFVATDQYIDEDARKQLGWTFGFPLLDELVRRTVDYVHIHHPGVQTVNGTTSQNIWTTAKTETTTEMHSRHFYVPRLVREGITYWYPEQTASSDYDGINSMYVDLMPTDYNQFGRNNHSWNRDGTPGPASTLAQTEGGSVPEYARQGGAALSVTDSLYLRAKWEIRALLFFANKGGVNRDGRGTRYYLYTLREGKQDPASEDHTLRHHQVAHPAFFRHLESSRGVYPNTPEKESAVTAKTFEVIKRTLSYLPIAPKIADPRALTVQRVSETHGNVQIASGPHGPLYNRDVLAALPFQTADDAFAVGLYVQTLNLGREYRKEGGPTRFDLPDEEYAIRLGGLKWKPGVSEARLVDVMTGRSAAVTPEADGSFRVKLTDYPRLLVLKGA